MPIKFQDLKPSPRLRSELDDAYERVMSSGRYIGGYEVEAFEKEWAEYNEVDFCVACGNGFDALQLVLRAYDIGPGDEVLVPEWTAIPTWAAVVAIGATPSPSTSRGQCLSIVVHLYGIPSGLMDHVIEDCAQAHGAKVNGQKVGSLGIAGAWSFYPTKNLGCYGDGGAITTDDEALVTRLREMRSYGCAGAINTRLDPLQAAFLRVKLPYLDGWNEQRRQNAARYLDGLKEVPLIGLPFAPSWCEPVWHQFVITSRRRDELRACLDTYNIETMIHYSVPPHRALGYDYNLVGADRLAEDVLSLPVAPHLTDDDIDTVIEAIKTCAC